MTNLFLGHLSRASVPADQETVRATATPVYQDKPAAVQQDTPVQNQVQTDSDPNLGMESRQLASHWTEGVQSAPFWGADVAGYTETTRVINEQVSTSGTAAQREMAGQFGHGSLSYAVGIEPVKDLTQGGKMTNDYFVRTDRIIQDTADNTMMTPGIQSTDVKAQISERGKRNARNAAAAGMYAQFWNGGA